MNWSEAVHEVFDKGALVGALLVAAVQWIATLRVSAIGVRTLIVSSFRLVLRSYQPLILVLAIGISAIDLLSCLGIRHDIAFPFAILGACILIVSTVLVPPTILCLGVSSDPETLELVRSIARAVFPLRVVHFLSPAGPMATRVLLLLSGARTREEESWEASVKLAASLVPIVLVDARVHTTPVEIEALEAIEPELIDQTVFVAAAKISPVFNTIAARLQIDLPALRIAMPGQVCRWMKELRNDALRRNRLQRGTVAERILVGTRHKISQTKSVMCNPLKQQMRALPGLTADQLLEHMRTCPACRIDNTPGSVTSLHVDDTIDSSLIPETAMIAFEGHLDWEMIRKVAADLALDLIVLSGNGPGSNHPSWSVDIVKLFARDLKLGLLIEKDETQPVLTGPLVAVRRVLISNWTPERLPLINLAELGRAIVPYVAAQGYKVRYERLIELPSLAARQSRSIS
jgi:hypothetical protein